MGPKVRATLYLAGTWTKWYLHFTGTWTKQYLHFITAFKELILPFNPSFRHTHTHTHLKCQLLTITGLISWTFFLQAVWKKTKDGEGGKLTKITSFFTIGTKPVGIVETPCSCLSTRPSPPHGFMGWRLNKVTQLLLLQLILRDSEDFQEI